MTSPDRLLAVTGVTGRLGGRVARRLADRGASQVLLARSPERVPALRAAEVRRADFADGATSRRALEGVSTLLMVSASETPDRVAQHHRFIDAAAASGVDHVVYISFLGASPTATFTLARDHWATEEHLRASGLAHTVLRDSLYADFLPLMVGADGVLRGPAGDGTVSAVAQDDIADAASAVLLDPAPHRGQTYDLTGPEALTLREIAQAISEVTDRPTRYHAESLGEAYASRAGYGAPSWQVDAWVSTYTAIAAGEMSTVSDAVPRLAGHPATPLREVLRRA
jgi:uncharacterized protein YbjT (DUF2867 family)